jgi:hypothetical protein
MRPDDIRAFLARRPFQPIRITLTDGKSYEVRHPELAMVGRTIVAIGLLPPDSGEPVFNRLITLSLLHIMQVEPFDAPTTPSSN